MLNFQNKKVIVTGGAGLIGSHLVENLVKESAKVIVVDDFSKGNISNLSNCLSKLEIREGNLESFDFVKNAMKDAKIIFHLASRAYGIGYSQNNHVLSLIHNEKITLNLLEYFSHNPPENLLVTSSSCVYSDDGPEIISEDTPLGALPEKANLGYGIAKRNLEEKFQFLANLLRFKLSIVRPFNIYGERYNWVGENSQAIPMLVKKILDRNNPIIVWGSGNQSRTYLHAEDCARIMKIIVQKGWANGPINIGLEKIISIKDLVNLICKINSIYPVIKFDESKPEGRFIKSSNMSRLKQVMGNDVIEKISLERGLEKMSSWYSNTFIKKDICE